MAKHRIIDTKFWTDSYIITLDPSEKLLFLYLLTSPHTTILGIFEITLRQICFDTGFDKDMVNMMLQRFMNDGKMYFFEGWIYIKNFLKYQEINPKITQGVKKALLLVPDKILAKIRDIDIEFDSLLKRLIEFRLSESESELELKSELESKLEAIKNFKKNWG